VDIISISWVPCSLEEYERECKFAFRRFVYSGKLEEFVDTAGISPEFIINFENTFSIPL
jgi:hypothetical protein